MIPALLLVHPALAATLSGTVRDAATGEPIAGLDVLAIDDRFAYAQATTTTDGSWSLVDLPAGRYRVWVTGQLSAAPWTDRYWPDTWDYCSAEVIVLGENDVRDGVDFELAEGAALTGRVLDPSGQPVAGATVAARGLDARAGLTLREVVTDADGAFVLPGLDADPEAGSPYALEVEPEDALPDQYVGPAYDEDEAAVFTVLPGEWTAIGDQPLLAGGTVSGTVTGPDGPVEGMSINVYGTSRVRTVLTDADGRYVAEGVVPGEVLVWGSLAGYGLTYYPDADRPGEYVELPGEGEVLDGVDLVVPREARLEGQLLGGKVDLDGVSVLLYNDDGTVGIGAGVEPDGRFGIGRLHGGAYTLYVYARDEGFLNDYIRDEDGEPLVLHVEPAETTDVIPIELVPGAVLAGRVVDDAGRPVYGATLEARPRLTELPRVRTDSAHDGTFALDGLRATDYTLQVSRQALCPDDPGYVTTWWPGSPTEDFALDLEPEEGEMLDGLEIVLPVDDDHDGMADAWEAERCLDPTRPDGDADPDGDGFPSLQEYQLGTDPCAAASGCGCGEGEGSAAWLLLPLAPLLGARRRRAPPPPAPPLAARRR